MGKRGRVGECPRLADRGVDRSGREEVNEGMTLTTKQSYSSPMSYVGITRRSTAWVRRVSSSKPRLTVAIVTVVLWLLLMYVVLLAWYVVIFGVFGLFTFPYRFIRRGSRKQEHLQREQLAAMQAMLDEQRKRP